MSKNFKLFLIVTAQLTTTSLWFAGNAIYPEIQSAIGFDFEITPPLTIAVQLGFIVGTFTYAVFMIPDQFAPSKVFLTSAILASFFNLLVLAQQPFLLLFISRFLVGFFLAGIYPVGMKIAADWFKDSLGNALGFLVGALTLGTAFPHFIKVNAIGLPWQIVIISTSLLALIGGFIIFLGVGDNPDRKKGKAFNPRVLTFMFKNKKFQNAAFGYFGHMWELYAFWAFTPVLITFYNQITNSELSISLWSFFVIGIGAIGCIIGGIYSQKKDSQLVAQLALFGSVISALLTITSLWFWPSFFIPSLLLWGFSVIPDSPQFSSLVAKNAPEEYVGSALTIVNCLGFGITILSIQLLSNLSIFGPKAFLILLVGPSVGLMFFLRKSN